MRPIKIRVKQVNNGQYPAYQSLGSSGFDIHAIHETVIEPGKWALVQTGLIFEIPKGYELQIRPRSGLALKHGITVLNAPGTVDSDYRGEVGVILVNMGNEPYIVRPGDRIAQGVIAPIVQAKFEIVGSLNETQRGEGGFGHTG